MVLPTSPVYLILCHTTIVLVFNLEPHSAEVHGILDDGGVARCNQVVHRVGKYAVHILSVRKFTSKTSET